MAPISHLFAVILLAINFLPITTAIFPVPKRGISYNDDIDISNFGGGQVFWQYNWASDTSSPQNYTEFVPMLWCDCPDLVAEWGPNVEKWLNTGDSEYPTTHLMGFNECDDPNQSNMTPWDAADAYLKYLTPYKEQGAMLVGPSVTNGGGGMGWMSDFWQRCENCSIDYGRFNWYGGAEEFDLFQI